MKVLIIRVLEACNAGCFMCGFAFSKDTYRFSAKDASQLCDEISDSGLELIRYTGGEPLLLDEFELVTSIFTERGYRVSTITNGWFLREKVEMLIKSQVSQVIVSIDGSNSVSHDRFRRVDGLFDRCRNGIATLKSISPNIVVRVNSVFGPHNIDEWVDMYRCFVEWGVDQWSIIPLKRPTRTWEYQSIEKLKNGYQAFQQAVDDEQGLRLLGTSKYWAGRTEDEFMSFVANNRSITPSHACRLIDHVRYYTPKDGFVYPCNCVPHHQHGNEFGATREPKVWTNAGLVAARDWLRDNGPYVCTGCEPVNVALGEGSTNLDMDPFGF